MIKMTIIVPGNVFLVLHLDHGFQIFINLNKSLEPMSETPCKYFLHSKSFNSLLYSQFILLLTNSRMQPTYSTTLKCIIHTNKASLEPNEEDVKSIQ